MNDTQMKQEGFSPVGNWIVDRLPARKDATMNGFVITPATVFISGCGYTHFTDIKTGEPWAPVLKFPPYPSPALKTKIVPFDNIKDFGDKFPIWVRWETERNAYLVTAMNNASLRVDTSTCWYADMSTQRWSTDPRTPYEECRTFTKEVPA